MDRFPQAAPDLEEREQPDTQLRHVHSARRGLVRNVTPHDAAFHPRQANRCAGVDSRGFPDSRICRNVFWFPQWQGRV